MKQTNISFQKGKKNINTLSCQNMFEHGPRIHLIISIRSNYLKFKNDPN